MGLRNTPKVMGYRQRSTPKVMGYTAKAVGLRNAPKVMGYRQRSTPKVMGYTQRTTMAPAQVYSLNLKGGKKYVGMTKPGPVVNGKTPLDRRLLQHFSGNGAKWTQKHQPVSVNSVQKCKSLSTAKKAETIVYYKMKDYHGKANVRGAGHTRSC
jgi:predicted GIY-YIG superfamily endonuclease